MRLRCWSNRKAPLTRDSRGSGGSARSRRTRRAIVTRIADKVIFRFTHRQCMQANVGLA